jgi:hypothetical protein
VSDPILARVIRQARVADLVEALTDRITATDLQSLLLHVFRRRSAGRTAAAMLAQRRRDRTVAPAELDGRVVHDVERLALEAAAGFDAVALAPVAPLGLNTALGRIDQNNVLVTIRGTEVLADPTTCLALEVAIRRRAGEGEVNLCCVDRVLRLQPFGSGFQQHFSLLSMATGGRTEADHGFELRALRRQLTAHVTLLAALRERSSRRVVVRVEVSDSGLLRAIVAEAGADLGRLMTAARSPADPAQQVLPLAGVDAVVENVAERVLATAAIELPRFVEDAAEALSRSALGPRVSRLAHRLDLVRRHVLSPLRAEFPAVRAGFRIGRLSGVGYYEGLLLNIDVVLASGESFSVADGGTTDWTQRLLSDRKERLLVSGIGLERVAGLL